MELLVEQVDVWGASIPDKPGGLAGALAALRDVGADLQLIIARRSPDKPGEGVVFVTPLQGDHEIRAAAMIGFTVAQRMRCVRVMGTNQAGKAADLTEKLAAAGINLRGFSAATIGKQFVAFVAVDSQSDADKATALLGRAQGMGD
ncbi:amino acid-binding protein [Cupriavidus sp. UYMSc13B]|nr:amino acid-binding protein [Cupriavidus sp. UYMSc13B]